jgi:hypothetical protein
MAFPITGNRCADECRVAKRFLNRADAGREPSYLFLSLTAWLASTLSSIPGRVAAVAGHVVDWYNWIWLSWVDNWHNSNGVRIPTARGVPTHNRVDEQP